MISNKKAAASNSAASVGGKTARACDSCVKKRARWYCAAADAFLCQTCDSSVHSANPLARRHERVKLKTSSSKNSMQVSSVPAWHRGFTKKPRTPRQLKSVAPRNNKFPIVPEVGADDMSNEENEDQEHVSYRVPIFDPFVVAELTVADGESTPIFDLPSDMELADFPADMDSLLGRGLDDHECFGMLGLGLMDYDEKEASTTEEGSNGIVKVEDDEYANTASQDETTEINLMREPFVLNFEDYNDNSPVSCAEDEEEEEDVKFGVRKTSSKEHKSCKKRKMILSLDYDYVISKWDTKRSPFAFGDRPDVDSDCLPDFMGNVSEAELLNYPYGDLKGVIGLHPATIDGGREARVTRYREKRRTRLFSKKIRYEVRKLNAEKRPRMKGRFVKRVAFGVDGSTCSMIAA